MFSLKFQALGGNLSIGCQRSGNFFFFQGPKTKVVLRAPATTAPPLLIRTLLENLSSSLATFVCITIRFRMISIQNGPHMVDAWNDLLYTLFLRNCLIWGLKIYQFLAHIWRLSYQISRKFVFFLFYRKSFIGFLKFSPDVSFFNHLSPRFLIARFLLKKMRIVLFDFNKSRRF